MRKRLLASSAVLMALAAAAGAQAAAPAGQAAPGAPAGAAYGIGEVIVTASRHAQNIQREALSIQALSGEALTRASVTKPEDLTTVAAGVEVGTGGNYPQVYIRGVGNFGAQAYAEGAVAFNLDGVYISRPWATRGMFYDLDRVEVLKGPQGTLYGRNASGGAINVITAKPKLGSTGGYAELEGGNLGLVQGEAAVNLPLSDTVALRASGQIVHRNGYLSDGYEDDKTQSGRLQLLWQPSTDFSLLLHSNYQHVGGKGAGAVVTPQLPGDKFRGASDPAVTAIYRAQPGLGPLLLTPKSDGFLDINLYDVGAELNWNLGFATLTLLPDYREGKLRDRNYLPGAPVEDNEHDKQTSLEARLANSTAAVKWVAGGYFYDEKQSNLDSDPLQITRFGIQAQSVPRFALGTRSYAAFGQATYSLTEQLRVTGGLRYTYERKTMDGLLNSFGAPSGAPPACAAGFVFDPNTVQPPLFCRRDIPLIGRLVYHNLTYKAGLEYDLAPRSMAFANVSTGFKSGGFYSSPPPNTFRPEKLTAIETGVKNRFYDNRLQLNVEGFYWKYRDHQESHTGPSSLPGFFTFVTENAGSAVSYGADLDVVFLATPQDELSLKVQYDKSRYDSFIYSWFTGRFGPPVVGCAVGPLVGGSQTVDCAGKQLVRAPTWSGTSSYSHTFELANGASVTATGDLQFASGYYLSIDFLQSGHQDAYAVGDFDLTYAAPGGRWLVSAFVHNIWDEAVLTQAVRYGFISSANPLANPDGLLLATVRPPRTFGARVHVNF